VADARPAYLRLGAGKKTPSFDTDFGTLKLLYKANNAKGSIVALGPVANNVMNALENEDLSNQFNIFTAYNLPLTIDTKAFEIIQEAENLLVVEEHVSVGGLAQQLSVQLLENGVSLKKFISLRAEGYPDGTYGSQNFHQRQSGLDSQNIASKLMSFIA
jgi:transketolase